MANVRRALLIGVLAAAGLAAAGGFFVVAGQSPGAARLRLLVDLALLVGLGIVVYVLTTPTVQRVDALVEGMRALALGDRQKRVNPDEYAGLGDLARALNEVAASLTEDDDPNLGPVKSTPRQQPWPKRTPPKVRPISASTSDDGEAHVSDHPEIGQVRKLGKKATSGEPVLVDKSAVVAMANAARQSQPPTPSAPATNAAAAPSNDTQIDEAPPSVPDKSASGEASEPSGPTVAAPAGSTGSRLQELGDAPSVPGRDELEALFNEFVAAKKSRDESVADLDLDAFATTIAGECERLIAAHGCKGVRFEVTMADGEVSLRPRLLR
jgi:HAMP domain-containing protein